MKEARVTAGPPAEILCYQTGERQMDNFFFLQNWVVVWNIFHFIPIRGNDPIWRAYLSDGLVQPPTRKLACLNLNLCQASFQVLCLSLNGITLNSHFVGNGAGNPKVAWHMQWKTAWDFSHFPSWWWWVLKLLGGATFSVQHGWSMAIAILRSSCDM